jgi:uncharacterized phiE125 gp8 family phage protein
MSCVLTIPPYLEPVDLTEAKLHLKVETATTDDDTLITALIKSARETVEAGTGANMKRHRVMLASTFVLKLDCFPSCGYIDVPRVPLVKVTSIQYVDTAEATQTFSSASYDVDTASGRIWLGYNESWPSTLGHPNSVTVTFVAGMMASFTGADSGDLLTIKGRTFTNADRVRVLGLTISGGLPTGLSVDTDYFVIGVSGQTCQLSLTEGGSAVTLTANGSGLIGTDFGQFEALRSAIKLLVGHWYRNREEVITGTIAQQLPVSVQALIAAGMAA